MIGRGKYTPLFPLDNDFSLVLSQLLNEVKSSVERAMAQQDVLFEGCLALSDGVGSVIQSADLAGQTHIQ